MGISKLTSDLTNIAGNIVSVLKAKVSDAKCFEVKCQYYSLLFFRAILLGHFII